MDISYMWKDEFAGTAENQMNRKLDKKNKRRLWAFVFWFKLIVAFFDKFFHSQWAGPPLHEQERLDQVALFFFDVKLPTICDFAFENENKQNRRRARLIELIEDLRSSSESKHN